MEEELGSGVFRQWMSESTFIFDNGRNTDTWFYHPQFYSENDHYAYDAQRGLYQVAAILLKQSAGYPREMREDHLPFTDGWFKAINAGQLGDKYKYRFQRLAELMHVFNQYTTNPAYAPNEGIRQRAITSLKILFIHISVSDYRWLDGTESVDAYLQRTHQQRYVEAVHISTAAVPAPGLRINVDYTDDQGVLQEKVPALLTRLIQQDVAVPVWVVVTESGYNDIGLVPAEAIDPQSGQAPQNSAPPGNPVQNFLQAIMPGEEESSPQNERPPDPSYHNVETAKQGLIDYQTLLLQVPAVLREKIERFPQLRSVMMGVLPEASNTQNNQEYFTTNEISSLQRALNDTRYMMLIRGGDWSFINKDAARRVMTDPANAEVFGDSEGDPIVWLEVNFRTLTDMQYGLLSGIPLGTVQGYAQINSIMLRLLNDPGLNTEDRVTLSDFTQLSSEERWTADRWQVFETIEKAQTLSNDEKRLFMQIFRAGGRVLSFATSDFLDQMWLSDIDYFEERMLTEFAGIRPEIHDQIEQFVTGERVRNALRNHPELATGNAVNNVMQFIEGTDEYRALFMNGPNQVDPSDVMPMVRSTLLPHVDRILTIIGHFDGFDAAWTSAASLLPTHTPRQVAGLAAVRERIQLRTATIGLKFIHQMYAATSYIVGLFVHNRQFSTWYAQQRGDQMEIKIQKVLLRANEEFVRLGLPILARSDLIVIPSDFELFLGGGDGKMVLSSVFFQAEYQQNPQFALSLLIHERLHMLHVFPAAQVTFREQLPLPLHKAMGEMLSMFAEKEYAMTTGMSEYYNRDFSRQTPYPAFSQIGAEVEQRVAEYFRSRIPNEDFLDTETPYTYARALLWHVAKTGDIAPIYTALGNGDFSRGTRVFAEVVEEIFKDERYEMPAQFRRPYTNIRVRMEEWRTHEFTVPMETLPPQDNGEPAKSDPVKFWPVTIGDQLELRSFEIQGNRLIAKGAITYVYPNKPADFGVKETPIRVMIALTTEEAEEFARNPQRAQEEILRRYKSAEEYVIGWHGYLETGEQFEPAADQTLASWDEQGKKQVMIALSHSGTEDTYLETNGYTAENLIAQVEDAVEYLVLQNDILQKPNAKVTVMGHSLGGGVALRLAEKHAEDTTGIWANVHYIVLTPYIGDAEQLTLLNDFQIIPGYPKTGILRVMNHPVMRYVPFVRAYIVWMSHLLGIGDALFTTLMSVDEIQDTAVQQSKAIALDTLDHAKIAIRMTQSLLTLKPVADMKKIRALSDAERLIIVSPNADDTLNTFITDKLVILHGIHRVAYAKGHNPMIKDMAGVVRQVVQNFFAGTPVEYPLPAYQQESAVQQHSFWGIVWAQFVQKVRGVLGVRIAEVAPQTVARPAHFDPTLREPVHYEDWERSQNSSSIIFIDDLRQWFTITNVSRDGVYRLVVVIPEQLSGGVVGMSINGFPVTGTVGIHIGDVIEVENGPTYRVSILGDRIGLADVALEQLNGNNEVTRTNANMESDHNGSFPEGNWFNTPRRTAVLQVTDGERIVETIQPWLDAQGIDAPAIEFMVRFPEKSVMLRNMYLLSSNVNSFYKLFGEDAQHALIDARTGTVIGVIAVHGRFLEIRLDESIAVSADIQAEDNDSPSLLEQGQQLAQKAKDDGCFSYNPLVSKVYAATVGETADEVFEGNTCPIFLRAPQYVIKQLWKHRRVARDILAFDVFLRLGLGAYPYITKGLVLPAYTELPPALEPGFCEYGGCAGSCATGFQCSEESGCCEPQEGYADSICSAEGNAEIRRSLTGSLYDSSETIGCDERGCMSGKCVGYDVEQKNAPSCDTLAPAEEWQLLGFEDDIYMPAVSCRNEQGEIEWRLGVLKSKMGDYACAEDRKSLISTVSKQTVWQCGEHTECDVLDGNSNCIPKWFLAAFMWSSECNPLQTRADGFSCTREGLRCTRHPL